MEFIKQTILVVDDNEDLLEALKAGLADDGFVVETAVSGAIALGLLEHGICPDLIVLDVRMPGMNGQEFLDRIAERHPRVLEEIPIVFSSAGKPPKDFRISGFIDKMTDLEDYLRQAKKFLRMDQRTA